jgi:YggT family protein
MGESVLTCLIVARQGIIMFVLGNFINALAHVIGFALSIYMWMIIIRALLSWVNPDPYNPIVQFLYKTTEPVLYYARYYVRRLFPPLSGAGIDISPIFVILLIYFLQMFLVRTLVEFSVMVR